jgi:osmoprotectant transport system permease protein
MGENSVLYLIVETFRDRWPEILKSLGQHMQITLTSLLLSIIIAVPLGIILTRYKRLADPVIGIAGIFQTIPSIALLGFMVPIFGIGKLPAIVALTVYALLPILRNTYTGILGVNRGTIEAGKGMGMTSTQILFMVEIPLSLKVIMAGIRTAAVIAVGTATLTALIGAGGLGDLIFRGVATVNSGLILAGAIPAAILAILFDNILKMFEVKVTPKGLRN